MSLSFPPSAINGQVYQGWVFDGEKWNPNWASRFVTSVNNKSGALMPADVVGPANRVLLLNKTVTAAVASIDMFYDFSTTTYDQYELDIYDLQCSIDGDNVYMRVSTDGSTFLSDANYQSALMYANASPNGAYLGGIGLGSMQLGVASTNTNGYLSEIRVRMSMLWTTDRVKYFMIDSVSTITPGAGAIRYSGSGLYGGPTYKQAFKGLSIVLSGGNITRAVANLYGLVKPPTGGT